MTGECGEMGIERQDDVPTNPTKTGSDSVQMMKAAVAEPTQAMLPKSLF